ncbi:hypothetical protein MGG_17360 [Pyricularia oryzae 70-15]|uniref:Uncharacterized protein n=2 Tax=Pyricularia oryzae TaxID=318829 RepID=G4NE04_PYRO7|nr:uncharacterized protein MGG_17360 [Pyricularia oryzae 70-15]EHA48539.1 hypothetical protein MGG_17360 [Pyricularia oryzae 70-15]KAI7923652.1 hypothetical protein M9X92_004262 [Pyricularia oryzae]QBZ62359.1 hypothetical protein PoMZ_11239 [Pyricularia oryzae]
MKLLRGRDRKIDRFAGRGFPSPRYDTFGLAVSWFTEDQTREPQSVQGGKPRFSGSVPRQFAPAAGTKQTRKTSRCSIILRQDLGSRADDSWLVKVTANMQHSTISRDER